MALDFGAIETAIATWLAGATSLPRVDVGDVAARIVVRNDKVPQPPPPYLTFHVPMPLGSGDPDEVRQSHDPAAAAGAEVVYTIRGERQFVCSVQAFTEAAVGGTDFEGNRTAKAYLEDARIALRKPSVRAALHAAGLSVVSIEGAADFSARLGAVGQGRATLDVRFRCVDSATDTTGYIDHVSATGDLTGSEDDVDFSLTYAPDGPQVPTDTGDHQHFTVVQKPKQVFRNRALYVEWTYDSQSHRIALGSALDGNEELLVFYR